MDCAKLQADIDKLSMLKVQLEERLDALSMDKDSISEARQNIAEFQAAEDKILEQYIGEIMQRNPDCYPWKWQAKCEIPNGTVKAIAALPDGRFIVSNNRSEIFIGSYAEDGSIAFSEAIEAESVVDTIVTAPNGDIFVGGSYGTIRRLSGIDSGEPSFEIIGALDDIARDGVVLPNGDLFMYGVDGAAAIIPRQDDGSFGQCQEFKAPRHPNGRLIPDNASVAVTPEGNVVMNTNGKGLQIFYKQSYGRYTLGEAFESSIHEVHKISTFPNGDLLVARGTGEIFVKRRRNNGAFGYNELVEGDIRGIDPYNRLNISGFNVSSLTPLPDGSILINYSYYNSSEMASPPICEIRKCTQKPDGEYEVSTPIFSSNTPEAAQIISLEDWFLSSGDLLSKLTVMPDGRFLAHFRQSGRIIEINHPKADLDGLKNGLADVAKKHA